MENGFFTDKLKFASFKNVMQKNKEKLPKDNQPNNQARYRPL